MASTNKTANLGLNQWIGTDKPKRSDFVSDNTIIDNILGNHINDTSIHLTAEEKDRASTPYVIYTVYGTGEATTTLKVGFTPRLVFAFKKSSALCEPKDEQTKVNSAIATSYGTTGGLTIENDEIVMHQIIASSANAMYNLNENSAEYIVIVFK